MEAWKLPSAITPVVVVIVTPKAGFLFITTLFAMTIKKNEAGTLLPMTVNESLTVNVLPYEQHEYLMTTRETANGYGTTKYSVLKALQRNSNDFVKGKHYILGMDILSTPKHPSIQHNSILLTKRGIVRLGFFIKSERAKLFRDWAEELIIQLDEQRDLFGIAPTKRLPTRRNHNRLTQERLISILADVCKIEDKDLRMSLTDKLMGGRA